MLPTHGYVESDGEDSCWLLDLPNSHQGLVVTPQCFGTRQLYSGVREPQSPAGNHTSGAEGFGDGSVLIAALVQHLGAGGAGEPDLARAI